jgi:hypothetical protein
LAAVVEAGGSRIGVSGDLSGSDEQAALVLQREGQHRQAIYFFLQAMEKLANHAIFSEVSPDDVSINGRTSRTHKNTQPG